MGNCAGGKPKNQTDPHVAQLKKPQQAAPVSAHPPHPHKQPEQNSAHPQKLAHKNPFEREDRHSDDLNGIGSLQIQSAKKDYSKVIHGDPIKETTQHAASPLKDHTHFTFSAEQEQTVAEENVSNYHNNHIRLNFEVRAS